MVRNRNLYNAQSHRNGTSTSLITNGLFLLDYVISSELSSQLAVNTYNKSYDNTFPTTTIVLIFVPCVP